MDFFEALVLNVPQAELVPVHLTLELILLRALACVAASVAPNKGWGSGAVTSHSQAIRLVPADREQIEADLPTDRTLEPCEVSKITKLAADRPGSFRNTAGASPTLQCPCKASHHRQARCIPEARAGVGG
jgi:hypothetical protein